MGTLLRSDYVGWSGHSGTNKDQQSTVLNHISWATCLRRCGDKLLLHRSWVSISARFSHCSSQSGGARGRHRCVQEMCVGRHRIHCQCRRSSEESTISFFVIKRKTLKLRLPLLSQTAVITPQIVGVGVPTNDREVVHLRMVAGRFKLPC